MPIEIMLLPAWSPFHIDKISYWARTVIVPLMVLAVAEAARRATEGRPHRRIVPAAPASSASAEAPQQKMSLVQLFFGLDRVLALGDPRFPRGPACVRIDKAVAFVKERLNGEDGLGAIFPGHGQQRDDVRRARPAGLYPRRAVRRAVEKLLVVDAHEAWCQPCVSPVWDTALAVHALLEVGGDEASAAAERRRGWLRRGGCSTSMAVGRCKQPTCRPGGWACNTTIRTIPTWTIPLSSSWRWIAPQPWTATPSVR